MDNVRDFYTTKDLGEASALLTSNCIMKDMQWKEGKAYFIFDNPIFCKKLSHQYFFENLKLSVRPFYENLRTIKRKLYAEQRLQGGERI